MKLGLFTACLADRDLADIAGWAAGHGYEALEVAAWPAAGGRPHTAAHIDARRLAAGEGVTDVRDLLDRHGLTLGALGYYDNPLDPDEDERRAVADHLLACIDAAAALECPTVGTFVGRHPGRSVAENLVRAAEVFKPIVDRAGERGVKVAVENCPMHGWHPDGYPGNLAYSPELWEWMFDIGLYLNFDPSHLVWLGIDPVEAVRPYVARVPHAQAKDTEVSPHDRNRYGTFGPARERRDPWDAGWWRYRVPGLGQVDWGRLVDALYEGEFDGTLAVEHEDPVWSGSDDRIEAGLEIAAATLGPLIVR